VIEHYAFGSIKIDGKNYSHDVIVSLNKAALWWRKTSHEVAIDDLAPILKENPKLIVFGTGAMGVMKVLPETEEYLKQQGIQVTVLPSGDAVKEYNLRIKDPGTVGAFHLTC
jgi:hypothetical protein